MTIPALQPPRQIASAASRHVLTAGAGAVAMIGVAAAARAMTAPPDTDGSSDGRIDRAEVRGMTSGPTGATTILPLAGALLCIPMLYTKGRLVMGGTAAEVGASSIAKAMKTAGTEMVPGELSRTRALYTTFGGSILGSLVADNLVFGGDPRYTVLHVPEVENR